MREIGFDSNKYLALQTENISKRIEDFGGKLYLEFGGKLIDDFHASRVLPGFLPDNKLKILEAMKDKAEIVLVVNSNDIATNKLRADLGITYDADTLRLIDLFRGRGLLVQSVVLSQFSEDNSPAIAFQNKLEKLGINVYKHYHIKGYPHDIKHIVSDEGYGKNEYIKTSRQLVVITAPGPGSGKMATCLSQLYHEYRKGNKSGYAKFETFPIWNLPLEHPVNIAYEAATADLNDINMIDPWHLSAYDKKAVNYNRDVEIFPVLNSLFEKLMGHSPYKSPTDMGVNMAGLAIVDDEVCCEASKQEIIRRYLNALVSERKGTASSEEIEKTALLMAQLGLKVEDRKVLVSAREKEAKEFCPTASIELANGQIVVGKTSDVMHASPAVILNAIKVLGNIDDSIDLIAKSALEPLQVYKTKILGDKNQRLHTDEVLIALASSASNNPTSKKAMEQLSKLRNCEIHTTTIPSPGDLRILRELGLNLTSDPVYATKQLYHA